MYISEAFARERQALEQIKFFFFSYSNFLITTVNRPRCTQTLKRRSSAVCVLVKTLMQGSHGEEKPAFVYPADSYKKRKRKERTAIK